MCPKYQGEHITFPSRHTSLPSRQCLVNKDGGREKAAVMWKEMW